LQRFLHSLRELVDAHFPLRIVNETREAIARRNGWVAHASRVLVSASRRNILFRNQKDRGMFRMQERESSRSRDAIASTRDACATQNCAIPRSSIAAALLPAYESWP